MSNNHNNTVLPHHDIALISGPCCANIDPIGDPALGAEAIFLGRTRQESHPTHGPLEALNYSAYETMALAQLTTLAEKAREDHGADTVRIHHALGRVPPGQISVLIQVRSGHRAEAFTACRWLIDELKQSVPIWKQEIWQSTETWAKGKSLRQPEVRIL